MDHKAGHTIQILCVGEGCHALPRSLDAFEYAMNTKRNQPYFMH